MLAPLALHPPCTSRVRPGPALNEGARAGRPHAKSLGHSFLVPLLEPGMQPHSSTSNDQAPKKAKPQKVAQERGKGAGVDKGGAGEGGEGRESQRIRQGREA